MQTLSKDLTGRGGAPMASASSLRVAPRTQLHGMQKRVAWAKAALKTPYQNQMLAGKRGLAHEVDVSSPFYSTSRGDPMATALSTEAGDDNWINALEPGDYWKDP